MIAVVYGTRPEAIKLGPIVAELKTRNVPLKILCTGQHTTLLKGTPAESDLADGISLGRPSDGNLTKWVTGTQRALLKELKGTTLVVVQGDTMSAMAGARAANGLNIPLAHVEAGIRSHDLLEPWPEEAYRVEIDKLAAHHYAPTLTALANLKAEGITGGVVTGNSGVSAIARYSEAHPSPAADPLTILVTLHRREFQRRPDIRPLLQAFAFAMARADPVHFLWPLHPSIAALVQGITWPTNVTFVAPLPYRACVEGLTRCLGVLTDSGGLQEDAATLGVPCAVLRNVCDRSESIKAGVARRFGTTLVGVGKAVEMLVNQELPRKPTDVFGNPTAACQIAAHLAEIL